MKVNIKESKSFKPIELNITIESEEELCDLYHRFNAIEEELQALLNKSVKHGADDNLSMHLFKELRRLVKNNNLYKQ